MDCVFCRIVSGELPCRKVLETDHVLAFYDHKPQAPVHVLVIPKRHVASILELDDPGLAGALLASVRQSAVELGLERGFRVISNVRAHGGQEVDHLHLHLVGGTRLGRMLPRWF